MEPLRIITINTGKGFGRYTERIAWMAEELQWLQPDLVLLQEVFRDESGQYDTAGVLTRALGLNCEWAPARLKERDVEERIVMGWSGMAMLSRHPWTYVDPLDLPEDERDPSRIAQVGLIEFDQTALVVANVHLTYLPDAEAVRRAQLETVFGHPLMQMKRAMRIIGGDFNSALDSDLIRELVKDEAFGNVRDAYVEGGGRQERGTIPTDRTEGQQRCIDFIFSVADTSDAHPLFTSSRVVLNRPNPDTGVLPSDHFGVASTLVPARLHGWLRQEQAVG